MAVRFGFRLSAALTAGERALRLLLEGAVIDPGFIQSSHCSDSRKAALSV